jgi:DNA helicase-2/ATP-dependent DNA helicase PcrA
VPSDPFAQLNPAQRRAAIGGAGRDEDRALLIIAGAGTGKTTTLAHRVAAHVLAGVPRDRILLLTFSRRAALEMTRRAGQLLATAAPDLATPLSWSGTFHSLGNRLLRRFAPSLLLDPGFTVLDRSDAADLMSWVRNDRGLAKKARRFPKKATCLAIYSRAVNARESLEETLTSRFPWCAEWEEELRGLFGAYVAAKQDRHLLDYDDLILYWAHMMGEPALAAETRALFDRVLVDEYQDTNALQAEILFGLCPGGRGLTAVGDDAQAIYSFRAARVENILELPDRCEPRAEIITLEESYRSGQPILDAANAVIALAERGYRKELVSARDRGGARPLLVTVEDETAQAAAVADRILEAREEGCRLRDQAVLFRTAHHSDLLEVELGRRGVPFVKFGGLKFLDAAHVKDLLCLLRLAENPRDSVAAFRILQLLDGVGPALAARGAEALRERDPVAALRRVPVAAPAREGLEKLCDLLETLADPATPWAGQLGAARAFYAPLFEDRYDTAPTRASDLDALEQIATQYPSRERFLSELTLDPPESSGDLAGDPLLDEDFAILSTIHSAKGQEWERVYVLNLVDGAIPSDMALREKDGLEEERRLLYVAMTRARTSLTLMQPLRFYVHQQRRRGDRHLYAPRSRFLPDSLLELFDREATAAMAGEGGARDSAAPKARLDVGARLRDMWS